MGRRPDHPPLAGILIPPNQPNITGPPQGGSFFMPAIIYALALLAAIYALPVEATPTKCEFIAVELFEAVDRGDLTEEEALDILDRCHHATFE